MLVVLVHLCLAAVLLSLGQWSPVAAAVSLESVGLWPLLKVWTGHLTGVLSAVPNPLGAEIQCRLSGLWCLAQSE